jgi:hypothetical protein
LASYTKWQWWFFRLRVIHETKATGPTLRFALALQQLTSDDASCHVGQVTVTPRLLVARDVLASAAVCRSTAHQCLRCCCLLPYTPLMRTIDRACRHYLRVRLTCRRGCLPTMCIIRCEVRTGWFRRKKILPLQDRESNIYAPRADQSFPA